MPEHDTRHSARPKAPQSKPSRPSRAVSARSQDRLSALQASADASAVVQRLANLQGVVQRVKYIRSRKNRIREVHDDYKKKKGERWSDESTYLAQAARRVESGRIDADSDLARRAREEEDRLAQEAAEEEARLNQIRLNERNRIANLYGMPSPHDRKQIHAPEVVGRTREGTEMAGYLIFRGMSPNNIKNYQAAQEGRGETPVFIAENPTGTASAAEHISDDSRASPYLSFETEGLGISAGKYAPKPVGSGNELVGVNYQKGHLKSNQRSYAYRGPTRGEHHRAGVVAGIDERRFTTEDYSTRDKAEALESDDAIDKAVADKEVLVKAGEAGIPAERVPFIALIEEISRDAYSANLANQSETLALGYYKPYGDVGDTVYYKIYIPTEYAEHFMFEIDGRYQRDTKETMPEMDPVAAVTAPLPSRRQTGRGRGRRGRPRGRRRDTRSTVPPPSALALDKRETEPSSALRENLTPRGSEGKEEET